MSDHDASPPSPTLELYVYYRSRPEDAGPLRTAVRAMQVRLQAGCQGLAARWLRRPELREGLVTWMEVYALPAGLAGDGAEALVSAIEREAVTLAPWLVGERRVERFLEAAGAPVEEPGKPPQGGR